MTGALRLPFNMLRYVGSQTDVGAEFFGSPTRFLGREVGGMIAGPTTSTATNLWAAGEKAIDGEFAEAGKKITKTLPFVNVAHIRDVLLSLGDN